MKNGPRSTSERRWRWLDASHIIEIMPLAFCRTALLAAVLALAVACDDASDAPAGGDTVVPSPSGVPTPTLTPPPTPTPAATPTPTPTPVPTPSPMPSPTPSPTPFPSPSPPAVSGAPATATPSPTANTVAGLTPPSPQDILVAALDAMAAAGSFHFELEGSIRAPEATSGIPISYIGNVQGPDRIQGKLQISLGAFFSMETESIVIGDQAYSTNVQTGEWEAGPGVASVLLSPLALTRAGPVAFEKGVLVGDEVLGARPVYHLRGVPPLGEFGAQDGDVQADIWVGVDDLLFWQIAGEGEVSLEGLGDSMGAVALSERAIIAMTMTFSAYGVPVEIEAPEVPEGGGG